MYKINDEQLKEWIKQAKDGDREAAARIVETCKPLILKLVYKMPLLVAGYSAEDLFQEGMLHLYNSIFTFDPTKDVQPTAFFYHCARRKLYTLILKSRNHKNSVLNTSFSLDQTLNEAEETTYYTVISANEAYGTQSLCYHDPAKCTDVKESLHLANDFLHNQCSKLERKVYELYLEGYSYEKIVETLQLKNIKMVDNTIQRVRKKLGTFDLYNYSPTPSRKKRIL
jgi:RNA polymerase sigma factor (sigma-70 family)